MNKRFNIDWDNELTQEQLINLILTDEDLPKLRSLTIVIGRHNTPAIADFFWQPYPFINVNKKTPPSFHFDRVFIRKNVNYSSF